MSITGNLKRQEVDRKTWAEYDTLSYDMVMRGRGEALTDEIYFGRAFSSPPTLSYSAVFDSVGDVVIPQAITPPRGSTALDVDTYGLSNHSMLINPIVYDPGFEHQGQFISELGDDARLIPDVHVLHDDSLPAYEQVQHVTHAWDTAGLPTGWPNGDGGYYRFADNYSNHWIQTDDQKARWEISSEKSHDLGVGAAGQFSAKYVFPVAGSSNWMIPIDFFGAIYLMKPPNRAYDKYAWITTTTEGTGPSSRATKGDARTPGPPYMRGWDGFAYVWSDDDCEFEAGAHLWWQAYDSALDNGVDTIVTTDDQMYGDSWDSPDEAHFRIVDDITQTTNIVGGQWNKVDIHLPHVGNRFQPNWPPDGINDSEESYWQLRYRVNSGSADQVVYIDNVYTWQILVNDVIPIMTVGVAEWITDEGGAFIGAKLWFKAGKP